MKYSNPIIPGFYPDPSICRVGQDYYLVTSTFEYFPGVPIFHSRDLVHWKQISHCLTRESQLDLEKVSYPMGIWAPTIRHHNGRFYMTTTNKTKGGNFIVHTENPSKEWSEPIWVKQEGIDPSILFDNERVYYITSSNMLSEIDIETGKIIDGTKQVWKGTGGRYPEGPHIYKKDGWYYLMQAEGGAQHGHFETIARSRDIWGPYQSCPHNPILSHVNFPKNPIQDVGHGDLIEAHDGSWWIVFLGTRPNGTFHVDHIGRETFLAPITWTEDGWPVVNGNGSVDLEMDAPLFAWQPLPEPEVRDDFESDTLNLCWNYVRNPVEKNYSLTERPGFLRLYGSRFTLSDCDAVTFLGRRQQHLECSASVKLDFEPSNENHEAGLVAMLCQAHHYEVAVTRLNGHKQIIVRRTIGTLSAVVASEEIAEGTIVLEIRADKEWYALGYRKVNGEFIELAKGETRFMSAPVAGGFTGTYLGVYASANGQESTNPADFDWFDYQGTKS